MNYFKRFHIIFPFCCIIHFTAIGKEATYSVLDFGATGDGVQLDTKFIQRAVDVCAEMGGGTVFLDAGTYLSGTIILKSNITFKIAEGAVLKGSCRIDDYRKKPNDIPKGILWGEHIENVKIIGPGIIDGNGGCFHDLQRPQELDNKYCDLSLTRQGLLYGQGVPDNEGTVVFKQRPFHTISLGGCKNIKLESFTIVSTPYWAIEINGCNDGVITGIRIRNNQRMANSDGLNIKSCRNIFVYNCDIISGDDAIAITTNGNKYRDPPGFINFPGPCTDVIISNCILSTRSRGVLIWANDFDIERILISSNIFKHCNRGINVIYNNGDVRDIIVNNCIIDTYITTGNWWGKGEPIVMLHKDLSKNREKSTNVIENITFSDIRSISEGGVVIWSEIPGSIRNITIRNFDLTLVRGDNVMAYGGNFDFRGHPNREKGIFKHDIAGIYAYGVNSLNLFNIRLVRSYDLPDFYNCALRLEKAKKTKMKFIQKIGF